MFLTKTELTDLTSYKLKKKQVQWLRSRGYRHEISADGSPKVLKDYIIASLGGGKNHITTAEPDFSCIQ